MQDKSGTMSICTFFSSRKMHDKTLRRKKIEQNQRHVEGKWYRPKNQLREHEQ
jgi:hypothetical protein